jgi:hypothetical protein
MNFVRTYSIPVMAGLVSATAGLRFASGRLSEAETVAVLALAVGVLAGSYAFARKLRRRPPAAGSRIYYFRSAF